MPQVLRVCLHEMDGVHVNRKYIYSPPYRFGRGRWRTQWMDMAVEKFYSKPNTEDVRIRSTKGRGRESEGEGSVTPSPLLLLLLFIQAELQYQSKVSGGGGWSHKLISMQREPTAWIRCWSSPYRFPPNHCNDDNDDYATFTSL